MRKLALGALRPPGGLVTDHCAEHYLHVKKLWLCVIFALRNTASAFGTLPPAGLLG
jgi:hypothetical protein